MSDPRHVVVAYDVASDRRRRRIAKILGARLQRVQASVFEGRVVERSLIELERALEAALDPEEDSVRIFRLCARCREATTVRGWGIWLFDDHQDVVL